MFEFKELLGHKVLTSDIIPVYHFFTTRSFILKTKEEDKIDEMNKNRKLLKEKLNLKAIITPSQRHTDNIEFVNFKKQEYEDTDALILKDKNIGIFLNFADCTPVILYDKKQNIGAIAHAGWRGTVQKIVQKTVFKMNSNPNDVCAVIGPSICGKCFETSKEIKEKLISTVNNKSGCSKEIEGKHYADLKEINKRQLEEIKVKNIDIAPYCTYCNNELFYSYRKENKTTNRMSAFLML